ncbi:MAG: fatty acid CoA ligase family protein [Deltaproteobacteria bacterium]|nr:fatty acid CoA ligase family protein [Deltaproteobacteria bacterium]
MNIADRFTEIAKTHHNKVAVRYPRRAGKKYSYDSITFGELETLANKYANGLSKIGFNRGSKTLLFVRPSLKFHALVFALFKLGVVPVLIDPGMGRKNLLAAIEEIAPQGLIAEPEVHFLSLIFSNAFKSVEFKVTTKGPKIGNCFPLAAIERSDAGFVNQQLEPDEMAAILFTSGGTGHPKGVVYTHKIYTEQTRLLQELFSLSDNEIDLPCFPLFSLFTLCMGMTSCIPDMDPSKPAKADPRKLLQNIVDNKVTFMAGSPAIWEALADYCEKNKIKLPSVKYLVMFGAPVRNELHKKFSRILPNGTTHTPYGATECLPVSKISGKIILEQTAALTSQGKGTCVGAPVPGVEVSIIKISEDVIENITNAQVLKPYQIGEIIVKGDIVTSSYYQSPVETAQTKIADNNSFWHRIGDLGYIDDQGRIWFCGRKTHRAETPSGLLCSVTCEAIFNAHPGVRRSALVALGEKGNQSAAIVIERNKAGKKLEKKSLEKELLNVAGNNACTAQIKSVHFCDQMPVDVRHNIKIDRLKLAHDVSRGKI